MKAFVLDSLDAPPALRDLPEPAPAAGQVLVRVQASSANPVDNAIAAGMLSGMVEHEFPVVLGRDYAGVVESGGDRFATGDKVYGFFPHANPTVHDGSWAELIVVAEDSLGRRPAVDLAVAGLSPLAGITALAAFDALELSEGDTLLIVGATGGVGSFAVQLAAHAGATVIAPALPDDEDYLRGIGAAERLDRDGDVRERYPDGVDAVLDLVSYAPGNYDTALKDGGRLVSPLGAAGEGPGRVNVMSASTTENLDRLGGLLADGTITPRIQATYELARAGEALQALASTHKQGKLAVSV